jgi:hypothetical protein
MKAKSLVVHDLRNPGPVVSMQQGTKQKKNDEIQISGIWWWRIRSRSGVKGGEERIKLKGAHDGCVTWTYAARPKGQRQGREWVHNGNQPHYNRDAQVGCERMLARTYEKRQMSRPLVSETRTTY